MTFMTYEGYTAEVERDPVVAVFAGRVVAIRDVISFEDETVEDTERAFHLSVDDYLAWAAEDGFLIHRGQA